MSLVSRPTFLSVEIFSTVETLSRLSRRIEIVEICREISTLSRPLKSENDEKSQRIGKSRHWCRDEIEKSRSQPRFLDCRDALFKVVKIFSTVQTHYLATSRWRLSILTRSRQIETPRLNLNSKLSLHFAFRSLQLTIC